MSLELYNYRAEYVGAYDGDTIRFDIDLGFYTWLKNQSVRLFGIDTPEIKGDSRELGLQSRDYVRERLGNAGSIYIRTQKDTKEKYGRWLAEVFVDGVNLNEELVEKGLAKTYII